MNASTVRFVDHTYRDYSRFLEDGGQIVKHKKWQSNFPAKLHKMVSSESNSHAVIWMPHGRSFKVIDKDVLKATVLPEYFGFNKIESFTRQLNGWGFKRLYQSGPDLGCYYHECFLRGIPALTGAIRRLPPNLGKTSPYPAGEPNFFRISERYPLPSSVPSNATATKPAAAEVAIESASSSRDGSRSQHPTTEPSSQREHSTPVLAATASSSAAPSRDNSLELLSRESTVGASSAATSYVLPNARSHTTEHTSNNPPPPSISSRRGSPTSSALTHDYPESLAYHSSYYSMSQNPNDRNYHQPQENISFLRPPYPTNFPQANNVYPGQYYGDRQYGQHPQLQPSQGMPPQYQYPPQPQPPQYQYSNYHPPPPDSMSLFGQTLPQVASSTQNYGRSLGTTANLRPSDSHGERQDEDIICPDQSSAEGGDGSHAPDPLLHSAPPNGGVKKDSSSDSPGHKTN